LSWGLCPQTPGIFRDPAIPGCQFKTGGAAFAATALVWPRSQRSGCIPAEPYPLPRSAPGL